jgi:hypothetical protein
MKARRRPFTPVLRDAHGNIFGSGVGRSPGTHLSQVIKYLRSKLGELTLTGNDNFAAMGFVFELWVEKALAQYLTFDEADMIEPGECCVDRIYMTPDRFNPFLGPDGTVLEFKSTHKSLGGSKNTPAIIVDGEIVVEVLQERFWFWLVQLMAYCRAMGTRRGIIVAAFLNGDYTYRPPMGGPQFIVIECEFTEKEIEENWALVKREARAMEREEANA